MWSFGYLQLQSVTVWRPIGNDDSALLFSPFFFPSFHFSFPVTTFSQRVATRIKKLIVTTPTTTQHNHTILFNLFQCLSLFNSRNFAQILSMLFGHLLVGAYTFCNILIITAIRMVRASPLLMSHYPSVSVSCFPSVTLVLDNICSGSICPGKKN